LKIDYSTLNIFFHKKVINFIILILDIWFLPKHMLQEKVQYLPFRFDLPTNLLQHQSYFSTTEGKFFTRQVVDSHYWKTYLVILSSSPEKMESSPDPG